MYSIWSPLSDRDFRGGDWGPPADEPDPECTCCARGVDVCEEWCAVNAAATAPSGPAKEPQQRMPVRRRERILEVA